MGWFRITSFQAPASHRRNIWVFPETWDFPPKSSILIGFSIINHPFWGTPIFGNTHIAKKCSLPRNLFTIKRFLEAEKQPKLHDSVATSLIDPLVVLTVKHKWTTSSFRMGKFAVRHFNTLYEILGYLTCAEFLPLTNTYHHTYINCLSTPNIMTLHKLLCSINILDKKEKLQSSRC